MDKNAIKKFAVWARTELIARVSLKGVESAGCISIITVRKKTMFLQH